jgi:hypothetical protein
MNVNQISGASPFAMHVCFIDWVVQYHLLFLFSAQEKLHGSLPEGEVKCSLSLTRSKPVGSITC